MSTQQSPSISNRKVLVFVFLTFAASWLIAAVYYALGGRLDNPISTIVLLIYMFMPMTMAIVVQRAIYKEPLRKPLRISFRPNRWFLVAWFLPPLAAVATVGVSLLIPGVQYSPDMAGMFERFAATLTPEQLAEMERQVSALPIHPVWLSLVQGLIFGITINAVAAFGEELGWRGLLQRELSHLGFWKSSALIGVIWGVWHAPVIIQGWNYPQHPVPGVFMMILWTLLLAPIFGYVTVKSRSVLAAAIIHGTLNATASIPLLVIVGGNDLTVGITGLAGFVVLAIINLGIFVFERSRAGAEITAQ